MNEKFIHIPCALQDEPDFLPVQRQRTYTDTALRQDGMNWQEAKVKKFSLSGE
jgi:hypothetical protein